MIRKDRKFKLKKSTNEIGENETKSVALEKLFIPNNPRYCVSYFIEV